MRAVRSLLPGNGRIQWFKRQHFKAGYIYNVNFSFKWNDPLTREVRYRECDRREPWDEEAIA